jgi:type IV pilus assembly protein PilC
VTGIRRYKKTEGGRRLFDSLKLRFPIVKGTTSMLITSRFTRTLSTLLTSGIPLIQALEVVARVVNNTIIEERMVEGIDSVRKGVSLARTVKDVGVFPCPLQKVHPGIKLDKI